MREIKFRGRCVITGNWAYGYYYQDKGHHIIRNENGETIVMPESVGQSIGVKGRDNKDTYTGDIVKCSRGCPHEVVFLLEHGGTYLGGMPTFYLSGLNVGYAWTGKEEIIGNIHENPELLK